MAWPDPALSWQLGRRGIVKIPRCVHSALFPSEES